MGVEQTSDRSVITAILDQAGTTAPVDLIDNHCFLIAYLGDKPIGIAGLQSEVDAALLWPVFVVETMRRRGVGGSLIQAARVAAHSRGARTLYPKAPPALVDYFVRSGFADAAADVHGEAQPPMPRANRSTQPSEWRVLRLDISRDGIIER